MINRFKKIFTASRDILALQSNVEEVFSQITPLSILDGLLITTPMTDVNGLVTVDHKLTRVPIGYFIADLQHSAIIKRISWDINHLFFKAEDTAGLPFTQLSFNIWVF